MSVPPSASRRRTLSLALYLPLLGALAALVLICPILLVSGAKAGVIRALAISALFLFFLGRRALFLYKGGEPSTLRDIALPAVADLLLLLILLSRLA